MICECGCGQHTKLATYDYADRGWIKGRPLRFVNGHNPSGAKSGPRVRVEDRGFDTPCWLWLLACDPAGYAIENGRRAARRAWERANGVPADPRMVVDHLCRVRACVNPEHLELVFQAENVRRGDVATLSYEDVAEIRRIGRKQLQREVAARYGVSRQTISKIIRNERWITNRE